MAYPPDHRAAYGQFTVLLFRDLCRDAYQQGGLVRLLRLLAYVLVDTADNVIVEHSELLNERNQVMTTQQHTRLIAIAGLPLVLGVVLLVVNPNFMRRMLVPGPGQPLGWLMSAFALLLMGASYLVQRSIVVRSQQLASREAANGGPARGEWMLRREFGLLLSTLFLVLPAVLIVLLGPAITMVVEFMHK